MTVVDSEKSPRPGGRPRNPRSDEAILDATRELLAELGVGGLTIEGVAARAGVAKTTIYRRWRSKNELALALFIDLAERMMPVRELGDTRAELLALVKTTVKTLNGTLMGRALQGLVSELATNSDLTAAFKEHVVSVRREEVRRVVERGIARGDLRADGDYELAPELLIGPVYYRLLLTHDSLDHDFSERVVDAVLTGFGARAT